MRLRALAPLLVLGVVASACGSEGGGAASATSTSAGAMTTRVVGVALATYSRGGGPAGRRFEVVVRPDGTFEGGTGEPGRGHLGTSALGELRTLLAGFVAARPQATYGEPSPDGFTTTVAAGTTTTSVHTDGAPPSAVLQLIGFLAGLERQLPR